MARRYSSLSLSLSLSQTLSLSFSLARARRPDFSAAPMQGAASTDSRRQGAQLLIRHKPSERGNIGAEAMHNIDVLGAYYLTRQ